MIQLFETMRILIFCLLCFAINSLTAANAETNETFVHIKRPALWVPDLDRAIVFYRDVLGFTLDLQGDLQVKESSVLFDLFNVAPDTAIRRALLSSNTERRALLVMEAVGAPEYAANDKRSSILVIQTHDLDSLEARAKSHGFTVANTNIDTLASGEEFRETAIIGPAGHAILVYQLGE